MIIKNFTILLPVFILVITTDGWANAVKTKKIATNQVKIIKMDVNTPALQKKNGSLPKPIQSLKTQNSSSQFGTLYKGVSPVLKNQEEENGCPLIDSLDKVIFPLKYFQKGWRNKFLTFQKVTEKKSSDLDFSQSNLRLFQNGNKDFEDERGLSTFKLFQSNEAEILKEIFMGFRLSLDLKSGRMFLEMNLTPSTGEGPGLIIPFWGLNHGQRVL